MPSKNKHVRSACTGPTVHDLRRAHQKSPGVRGLRWRFSAGIAEVGKGFWSAGLNEREKIEGVRAGESPGCVCGFVVLDKHKQGKISSQVNNPICYKQPTLSPWQRGTDAEGSPHIPWWRLSKMPRSRRTWHSVREHSDLHVSPSHLLQPWHVDPITTCKCPPTDWATGVIHCINALTHVGENRCVCVNWGMREHLCSHSLYMWYSELSVKYISRASE